MTLRLRKGLNSEDVECPSISGLIAAAAAGVTSACKTSEENRQSDLPVLVVSPSDPLFRQASDFDQKRRPRQLAR
jgi:hypothetical protein